MTGVDGTGEKGKTIVRLYKALKSWEVSGLYVKGFGKLTLTILYQCVLLCDLYWG